ncbi:MAG: hypothetical protein R3E91_04745 [Chlamydiales bacterium]
MIEKTNNFNLVEESKSYHLAWGKKEYLWITLIVLAVFVAVNGLGFFGVMKGWWGGGNAGLSTSLNQTDSVIMMSVGGGIALLGLMFFPIYRKRQRMLFEKKVKYLESNLGDNFSSLGMNKDNFDFLEKENYQLRKFEDNFKEDNKRYALFVKDENNEVYCTPNMVYKEIVLMGKLFKIKGYQQDCTDVDDIDES